MLEPRRLYRRVISDMPLLSRSTSLFDSNSPALKRIRRGCPMSHQRQACRIPKTPPPVCTWSLRNSFYSSRLTMWCVTKPSQEERILPLNTLKDSSNGETHETSQHDSSFGVQIVPFLLPIGQTMISTVINVFTGKASRNRR